MVFDDSVESVKLTHEEKCWSAVKNIKLSLSGNMNFH